MVSVLARLRRRPGLQLVGSTALSQILLLMLVPVLSRLYLPEDFGVFSIFSAVVVWSTHLSTLKYETAIFAAPNSRRAAGAMKLASMVAFGFAGLVALLVVLVIAFSPSLDAKHVPLLWLLPLSILVFSLHSIYVSMCSRSAAFTELSKI
ncbi:MAG TPA: hypothetical protein VGE01_08895, partial [Fimbriimonas sp.]